MTEEQPEPVARERRLVRSREDRVIAGVCGGLGRYLGVDPVLIRIAAIILVFAGGTGLVLYVVGWIAMPEADDEAAPGSSATEPSDRRSGALLGVLLVALGAVFLVDEVWPDFLSWEYLWPIALIAVGVAILLRSRR